MELTEIEYTEVEYGEISQITRGKIGYGKVRFSDLESVVKFTARDEEKTDPLLDSNEKKEIAELNKRFYQRIVNDTRTYNIQQFIIQEAIKEYRFKSGLSKHTSLGVFPTSTLIAVNSYGASTLEEYKNKYYDFEKKEGNQITLCHIENGRAYLPKDNKIALIVDGQHRIAALRDLSTRIKDDLKLGRTKVTELVDSSFFPFLKERIQNFEFLCTLLINFNIYEQGEIFASVNFNQKPVNRSLYYDIFGSSPNTDKNELKLAHDLVRHLNYNTDSVLKGLIDMLGNGEGVVSQSAVVESLMKLFSKNKCWHIIYMDYRKDGIEYKKLGLFLRLYFSQIKETFKKYWPKVDVIKRSEYDHVLVKTTGMGAFIKLINDIYPDLKEKVNMDNQQEISENLKEIFLKIEKRGDYYFDSKSEFVKGAGLGMQSKLYKLIAYDLGYRKTID